ncbi:MAG: zinc ribbon domain-containing protein [Methanobacteriota archaeon]
MEISKKVIVLLGLLFSLGLSTIASATNEWDYYDSGAAAGFLGLSLMICAAFFIVYFVVFLLIAIWVYKDAEKRGKSGILWLILVILLGIIGIVIWLVVRPPIGGEKAGKPARMCPNCGRAIPEDARVCPYCNKKFDE